LDMKIGLADAATVAKVVGVSRQRINNLVADGVLPRADRGRFDLPSTVQAFFARKYAKARAGDVEAKSLTSERSRVFTCTAALWLPLFDLKSSGRLRPVARRSRIPPPRRPSRRSFLIRLLLLVARSHERSCRCKRSTAAT
jgi:hypothetical protein